nr:MAG TPA: hypothetical protein [Caudoviricetes sp.]
MLQFANALTCTYYMHQPRLQPLMHGLLLPLMSYNYLQ